MLASHFHDGTIDLPDFVCASTCFRRGDHQGQGRLSYHALDGCNYRHGCYYLNFFDLAAVDTDGFCFSSFYCVPRHFFSCLHKIQIAHQAAGRGTGDAVQGDARPDAADNVVLHHSHPPCHIVAYFLLGTLDKVGGSHEVVVAGEGVHPARNAAVALDMGAFAFASAVAHQSVVAA